MAVSSEVKSGPAADETAVQGREEFATRLGVLAATLGSAVGLGNIWKFPYLVGANGGAAFILVYLGATLLVGLPVMISEQVLGRRAKADAITTLQKLSPSKRQPWWLIGAGGFLGSFLIMAFYTAVAGWVFAYIFKAAFGGLLSTDPQVTSAVFEQLTTNPIEVLAWQWIVLFFIGFIILFGVSKGIERVTKRLMPVLFMLLIVIGIRGLTLPGALDGLIFLFKPDFSKLTSAAFLTAMGLAFFKLSIGMGAMITYGSYFRKDQDIPVTATRVMLADLAASILAGIAIFPAVFAFGFEPTVGPSLLFITIPAVFASMPFGQFFMVAFFVLAAIAATGAMLSLLEVAVSILSAKLGLTRPKATVVTVVLLGLVGSTAALSSSTLANITPFGMTFFDLYDYLSSNILLPVGGLFVAIFIGWFWGYNEVRSALTNEGTLGNERTVRLFFGVVKFVSPVLVLMVLLNGLGVL